MELCFTDDTYVVHGAPCPRVPFIVDKFMEEVRPVNDYLYYLRVKRGWTGSVMTPKTYAEAIYDFLRFCEENGLEWNRVTFAHLIAWRNLQRRQNLEGGTINQRIFAVARFYRWAKRRGLIQKLPFEDVGNVALGPDGRDAKGLRSGEEDWIEDLTVPVFQKPVEFVTLEDLRVFLPVLRPRRNRLIGCLYAEAGVRRLEGEWLSWQVLPDPSRSSPGRMIWMTLDHKLTPTKRNKTRKVQISPALAEALQDYYRVERPALARMYRRNHGRETDRLFLTEYGEPLSEKHMDNACSESSKATSIRATPLTLRHTFATYELLRLQRESPGTALVLLKQLMGHESIRTTMRYIASAALVGQMTLDEHQREISAIIAEALRG